MNYVIEAINVTRHYTSTKGLFRKTTEQVTAVNDLSFKVREGEIFGLLGPNGAGKSTMIKMMTTLLIPSDGQLTILGHDVSTDVSLIREKINFVFGGERNLYWRLSAYDNMVFFCDIYKIPRHFHKELIDTILKRVDLYEVRHRKVESYSKGMKQRLQIAKSLINRPKILFLDEPTIGLDPIGAKTLRKIIKEESEKGTTVILTTHYMQEAEELCERVAIINKGHLVALDTIETLKTKVGCRDLESIYIEMVGEERAV